MPLDGVKPKRVSISNNLGNISCYQFPSPSGTASNVKLKVKLEVKDFRGCVNTYRPAGLILRDTQLCAGGVKGEDTCSGDSGGPFTKLDRSNNYLIGIVSFGPNKCGTAGVPGVYTNVAMYTDWIKKNVRP